MDNSEDLQKERQQEKHYSYLKDLQNMAGELPLKYQQRLPYTMLSDLASVLLDDQLFEIVDGLKEVQQLEERNLSNKRTQLLNEHRNKKNEITKKHKELLQANSHKSHNIPLLQSQFAKEMQDLESKCAREMKTMDCHIIKTMDQKIIDQQNFLEKAGIPGFVVTVNSNEVQLQMYLLDFIIRLKP